MIIIIDGYNLLKQIFPNVKGHLDQQRTAFVRHLGYYKHKKSSDIKEIIIVFDAGPFGHATREIHQGVVVIFSGQKSTADDWIIEYVEKHRNEEILVVTNDRKIISASLRCNASTLSSNDFYQVVQNVLMDDQIQSKGMNFNISSDIKKLKADDYFNADIENLNTIDQQSLDMLMEQASFGANKNDDVSQYLTQNKQKAQKLSKKEKKLYSKLKKLY